MVNQMVTVKLESNFTHVLSKIKYILNKIVFLFYEYTIWLAINIMGDICSIFEPGRHFGIVGKVAMAML